MAAINPLLSRTDRSHRLTCVISCVCVQVVLRGGLVAPWDAVPPLVAQLTDELPETRAAALRVRVC